MGIGYVQMLLLTSAWMLPAMTRARGGSALLVQAIKLKTFSTGSNSGLRSKFNLGEQTAKLTTVAGWTSRLPAEEPKLVRSIPSGQDSRVRASSL
jgi:hypothetical protein